MPNQKNKNTRSPQVAAPKAPKIVRNNNQRKALSDSVRKAMKLHKALDGATESHSIDPAVRNWSDQLHTLFDRGPELYPMPLFENNFPCPSTLAVNYSAESYNIGAGITAMALFPTHEGAYFDTTHGEWQNGYSTFAGPQTYNVGPIVYGNSRDSVAIGTYQSAAEYEFETINCSSVVAQRYDRLLAPFECGDKGMSFRTVAYGVRVSYIGEWSKAKGYVELMQPYEPRPSGAGGTGDVDTYRRDNSYRRHFFAKNPSLDFYFEPTCDNIKFRQDSTLNALTWLGPRMQLRVGGLAENDVLMIEVVCVQEWAGHKAISTQVPRSLTPDATHVVNAIVHAHGEMNPGSDAKGRQGKAAVTPAKVALGIKAQTHPLYEAVFRAAPGVRQALEYVREGYQFARKVGKVTEAVSQLIK